MQIPSSILLLCLISLTSASAMAHHQVNGNAVDHTTGALSDPRTSFNGRMTNILGRTKSLQDSERNKEEMFAKPKEEEVKKEIDNQAERYERLRSRFVLNRKLTDSFTIELFLSGYDGRRINVASLENSLIEWYVIPPSTALDSFCKNNPSVDMCTTAHRRDIKGKAARLRSHAGADIKETFAIMNGKRLSPDRLKKMLPSTLAHLVN